MLKQKELTHSVNAASLCGTHLVFEQMEMTLALVLVSPKSCPPTHSRVLALQSREIRSFLPRRDCCLYFCSCTFLYPCQGLPLPLPLSDRLAFARAKLACLFKTTRWTGCFGCCAKHSFGSLPPCVHTFRSTNRHLETSDLDPLPTNPSVLVLAFLCANLTYAISFTNWFHSVLPAVLINQ